MYRDLFLFDMPPPPPPPPPKPIPPPPPPPPPTPEQLAAAKLAQDRQEATNSRPQTLHYLGYMGRSSTGRIGSFLKGEEIMSMRVGDLASPNWKLVTITETYAEFQHLRFQDIRYRTEARDRPGNRLLQHHQSILIRAEHDCRSPPPSRCAWHPPLGGPAGPAWPAAASTRPKRPSTRATTRTPCRSYREILRKDPTNVEARIGYRRAATRAAEKHLADAREAERRGPGRRGGEGSPRGLPAGPEQCPGPGLDRPPRAEAAEAPSRRPRPRTAWRTSGPRARRSP